MTLPFATTARTPIEGQYLSISVKALKPVRSVWIHFEAARPIALCHPFVRFRFSCRRDGDGQSTTPLARSLLSVQDEGVDATKDSDDSDDGSSLSVLTILSIVWQFSFSLVVARRIAIARTNVVRGIEPAPKTQVHNLDKIDNLHRNRTPQIDEIMAAVNGH